MTGDIVNVAARAEFPLGRIWMNALGSPDAVSFVPGNHDTYVPVDYGHGLGHFEANMIGDMMVQSPGLAIGGTAIFPYVRLRRNIALIGVTTAQPQSLRRASGSVGAAQLNALADVLALLKARGFCRVVMMHHAPIPGITSDRRALRDVVAVKDVLATQGAELVLHGHNHKRSLHYIEGKHGRVAVVGAPSVSLNSAIGPHKGGWSLFKIDRAEGRWTIHVTDRSWDQATATLQTTHEYKIST
jgi:3',5'-cyclic AMP phosphodiesterase CpdA